MSLSNLQTVLVRRVEEEVVEVTKETKRSSLDETEAYGSGREEVPRRG